MQPGAKYLKRSEWSLRHIFKQVVIIINYFISTHMLASNIAIFEAMLMVGRTYVEMVIDEPFDDCDLFVSCQLAGLVSKHSVLMEGVLRNLSC